MTIHNSYAHKTHEICAKEELDLDQLHELEAVVVDEVLSGSSWAGQLIHNPSCQLQNPNYPLLQHQSIKNRANKKKKHF